MTHVSIPLKDEVRSVEFSTMGDVTRKFLVEDIEPVDSITGLTEDSLDILKPLVTTSVPNVFHAWVVVCVVMCFI